MNKKEGTIYTIKTKFLQGVITGIEREKGGHKVHTVNNDIRRDQLMVFVKYLCTIRKHIIMNFLCHITSHLMEHPNNTS